MRLSYRKVFKVATLCSVFLSAGFAAAEDFGSIPQYGVVEIPLTGPQLGPTDTPARDVELSITLRHESGEPTIRVHGFWDGDGRGAGSGNVFKVRFCPTSAGRWQIVETASNRAELKGQREGDTLTCVASELHGFWLPDDRWYKRSDGSHQYIVGNTHYSFLSRYNNNGPVTTDPLADIRANAEYYKKLRFSLLPCRYPDPNVKPFLDDRGRQTNDGRYSLRPNPAWFSQRVDPVIQEGLRQDLICDLILCGPDTPESRSTLLGDPKPWMRYVAARYGAYPNVWFCLANEWNIKSPKYTAQQITAAGDALRAALAYPTPVSVHANTGDWDAALNGAWHDHVIIQNKIKRLPQAADATAKNFRLGGNKPVVNDENAYQGAGDNFSKEDVVEGCFGTLLGGGYATTGEKYASKLGQYFWGSFNADTHSASPHLGYLRHYLDRSVRFWNLNPVPLSTSPFANADSQFRLLASAAGDEFILGSNHQEANQRVTLPAGQWQVTQLDLLTLTTKVIASDASGTLSFDTPDSRAVLTHFRRIERRSSK